MQLRPQSFNIIFDVNFIFFNGSKTKKREKPTTRALEFMLFYE